MEFPFSSFSSLRQTEGCDAPDSSPAQIPFLPMACGLSTASPVNAKAQTSLSVLAKEADQGILWAG